MVLKCEECFSFNARLKYKLSCRDSIFFFCVCLGTALVASWVRALASHVEVLVFESQPRCTLVVKTGCDSSTAVRSAIGVSVTGPRRWPLWTEGPCHSKCGVLQNPPPNCSMAMNAKHVSKYEVLHRHRWRPYEWKIIEWGQKTQTNKTNNVMFLHQRVFIL